MEVTYVIIVFIFTYILGAISKFKFESSGVCFMYVISNGSWWHF